MSRSASWRAFPKRLGLSVIPQVTYGLVSVETAQRLRTAGSRAGQAAHQVGGLRVVESLLSDQRTPSREGQRASPHRRRAADERC